MQPNLIVFYGDSGYFTAQRETTDFIRKLGDDKAECTLGAPGIMLIQTTLKPRQVIEEVKETYLNDPQTLPATNTWIPIDNWCHADLTEVREILREDINYMIGKEDRIILDYNEHNATLNAKKEIDGMLGGIRDKDHPEKILRVDVFEEGVNVTLMRPKDLFEKK